MTYTLPHFAERFDDRLRRIPHAGFARHTPRGEAHGKTRHTDAEVRAAVERVHAGEPVLLVAESIGVHQSTLRKWARRSRRPEATQALAAARTAPKLCTTDVRAVAGRATRLRSI